LVILSRSPCAALASFRWRNLNAVFAIRGEYAVESGEVDPRLGDQSCQAGQKVEWFEDHVGGAVPIGCFQLIPDPTIIQE
jgi:hypothetical protein